jgi:hypothetical protein
MKNVASGISGASPIWRREMLDVLAKRPDKPFVKPEGVSEADVDKISGYPVQNGFESYKDFFVDQFRPQGSDPIHTKLKVCKSDNNRLADAVTISQGNYDEKEFVILKERDPLTDRDLWQKGIDTWIAVQTDSRYKIPTEYCNSDAGLDIQIVTPGDKSRVDGDVQVRFEVTSSSELTAVELWTDGIMEKKFDSAPYSIKLTLATGNHNLKVVARNKDNKSAEKAIDISVNVDFTTPTPSPTPTVTATPSPTVTP